ncbi:MAG: hypothetical protein O3B21_08935 [Proteobacteria bacterium]|nr:hypothetical protein [Pseudomonadota bacterium]MDA1356378.1 hypothetical protein [Pseudomonadota bacterium]
MIERPLASEVARRLAEFYEQPFGGKANGRYRVSPKLLRRLAQRRRISDEFAAQLAEEMFELGYVFIDLESFYVVTGARTYTNYRRLAESSIK